ncbi:MAG: DUF4149 domain-containing protein [Verrucomicrobiota bacterium]
MIGLLRFFGLLNAAVWLGAAVSFTYAIGPGFFSNEMKAILPPPWNGGAAQIILQRYFILLHCCGAVALLHLFLEKIYLGKKIERLTLAIVGATIFLGLLGGFWFQPKLKDLHLRWYDPRSPVAAREQAHRSFSIWHGASQTVNLFVMGGLLVYFWRLSNPPSATRFASSNKFRS